MSTTNQDRIRLVDVADAAGVDKAVVSRVVNADPTLRIRDETRARVVEAIERLGYRPNAAARSLRTSRSMMIGLFIPDFANPVYAEIIKGAESAAARHRYAIVTSSLSSGLQIEQRLERLTDGRVDGLLLAGGLAPEQGGQEYLNDLGIPWLFVNRRSTVGNRTVVLDDVHAARLAVDHLVTLGHEHIAHVAGPDAADTARRRQLGYEVAMREAGLTVDPSLVRSGEYTPEGGYSAMEEILAAQQPTGVVVANVASAFGVLKALVANALRVPQDVSVVAIHDFALAGYMTPSLTTVRMPLQELGARSVDLLLQVSPQQAIDEIVADPIELVVRESTAKAPR